MPRNSAQFCAILYSALTASRSPLQDRFNEHPFLYIIAAPLFVVLIDTGVGTANYADFVLEFLDRQLGSERSRPPLLVINTHCHFDHIGSNAFLAARGGELAASGANQKFTNAALDAARDCSLAKMVGCTVAPYQISRWLANGEHIALSEDCLLYTSPSPRDS